MVSLDAKTRIKVLDEHLFPLYIEFIVGHTSLIVKQYYVKKIISNTTAVIELDDCNVEELKIVVKKYIDIIKKYYPVEDDCKLLIGLYYE